MAKDEKAHVTLDADEVAKRLKERVKEQARKDEKTASDHKRDLEKLQRQHDRSFKK